MYIQEATLKHNILHKHAYVASTYVVTQYIPLFALRICGTLYSSICDAAAKEKIPYFAL